MKHFITYNNASKNIISQKIIYETQFCVGDISWQTVHCDIETVFECRHLAVWPPKKTFLSNILAVRNCCDAYSFYFPASTSDLLMQAISLPLGSLLAVVLGHIILYENVGWQALAVRQNSAARCLSLQLFWKSAWIFFFMFPILKPSGNLAWSSKIHTWHKSWLFLKATREIWVGNNCLAILKNLV